MYDEQGLVMELEPPVMHKCKMGESRLLRVFRELLVRVSWAVSAFRPVSTMQFGDGKHPNAIFGPVSVN
jgi:hypothetical protein